MIDPSKQLPCLVLGARGFIGSHLVDALLDLGVPTRIMVRPLSAISAQLFHRQHPLLEIYTGDFNNEVELRQALDGVGSCVHLISSSVPKSSNENIVFDVQSNLISTVRLLEYAQKSGVKKIVFLSSGGAVYGDAQYIPIDERHPTNPKSSYGITKLASEKYCQMLANGGLATVTLRLSNPYGPRQRVANSQGAIAVFLGRAMNGETINIWGDGEVVRDYIYIDDCIDAILKALTYEGSGYLYNIGSGIGRSLNEIVAILSTVLKRKIDVVYSAARSVDANQNILDTARAQVALNWRPVTAFEAGLDRTVAWYRENLNERKI